MAMDGLPSSTTGEPTPPGFSADMPSSDASPETVQVRGSSSGRTSRRRRKTPTRVVSATGSLLVHGLLLVLLAAVVWRTASLSGPPAREVSISFEAPAMGDAPIPTAGRTDRPVRDQPVPRSREVIINLDPPSPPVPTREEAALPSLATQPLDAPSSGPSVRSGPEMDFAPAGAPVGPAGAVADPMGAGQSGVTFAGLGASNARSVVYVVDASGSMVTSLPFVVAELRRSVSQLAATQKFGVVLFRRMPDGRSGVEVFAPVLVRATPSAQERLAEWLSTVHPAGRSVPLAGLERAVAYKPDAVFLLSRAIERSGGDVWETGGANSASRGLSDTMARIDALNPLVGERRAVVIQTIQFLDDDPTGIMQEIGRVHGSRVDSDGRRVAGYRVIRRGEDLGVGR